MKHNIIWAYLIRLSDNMWGDTPISAAEQPFHSQLYVDDAVWRPVVDVLPAQSCDAVQIVLGNVVVITVFIVWGCHENAQQTMELAKTTFASERTKGFMTAPWRMTYTENLYALLNDAYQFGLGKKGDLPGVL